MSLHTNGSKTDPLAIASLALGVATWLFMCCCYVLSVPLAVVGIGLGIAAMNRIADPTTPYTGKRVAIAGLAFATTGLLTIAALFVLFAMSETWGPHLEQLFEGLPDLVESPTDSDSRPAPPGDY